MTRKTFLPLAAMAAFVIAAGSAGACELNAEAPTMPDPTSATKEDVSATLASIKAFQTELGEYRACLETITDDKEIDKATRKAALEKFNDSVDLETAMVEDWQAFSAARKDAQG